MIACFLVLVQPFCSFAEGTGLFGDGRLTLYANHESKSQSLSCIIETGVAFRAKCKIFSRHLQKPILKTEKGRFKGL